VYERGKERERVYVEHGPAPADRCPAAGEKEKTLPIINFEPREGWDEKEELAH
jgi:hypothetical protein